MLPKRGAFDMSEILRPRPRFFGTTSRRIKHLRPIILIIISVYIIAPDPDILKIPQNIFPMGRVVHPRVDHRLGRGRPHGDIFSFGRGIGQTVLVQNRKASCSVGAVMRVVKGCFPCSFGSGRRQAVQCLKGLQPVFRSYLVYYIHYLPRQFNFPVRLSSLPVLTA